MQKAPPSQGVPRLAEFRIPSELGRVVHQWHPPEDPHAPDRLVVLLQEDHSSSALRNQNAQILSYLIETYGIFLIGSEGAGGWADPALLRFLPAEDTERRALAQDLLNEGRFTPEEFVLMSENPFATILGLESSDLYARQLALLEQGQTNAEALQAWLAPIHDWAAQALTRMPADYRELWEDYRRFQNQELDLGAYLGLLLTRAYALGMDVDRDYPAITQFLDLELQSLEVSEAQAKTETRSFLSSLAVFLAKGGREWDQQLVSRKLKDFQNGDFYKPEFYQWMFDFTDWEKMVPPARLMDFSWYLESRAHLDAYQLRAEVLAMHRELLQIAGGDRGRALARVLLRLERLEDLSAQRLEWKNWPGPHQGESEDLSADVWLDDLINQLGELRDADLTVQSARTSLKSASNFLKVLVQSYEIAQQRSVVFADNLLKHMDRAQLRTAIAITGGFHTPVMAEYVESRGIACAVVLPRFSRPGNSVQESRVRPPLATSNSNSSAQ
ncbi:MAG: hypothetical protein JW937_05300, partial [Candidatus Omnitrophica bacterium]|nr:hypothetical protein [Candidatus Omnitrophota bacterium]